MIDEAKVRDAVRIVQEEGWRLRDRNYGDSAARTCCPMGAVSICFSGSDDCTDLAPAALGISFAEVDAFTRGFDGIRRLSQRHHRAAYDLGLKFRTEFLKDR